MSTSFQSACVVIHPQQTYVGKQGHTFLAGISAETVGAKAICMHLLRLAPRERGRPHLHEHHETALYILSGQVEVWYDEQLQKYLTAGAGDFLYVPAGMPHLPCNRSQTDSCLVLIARTDPNDQESVVLLPQLNEVPLQKPDIP